MSVTRKHNDHIARVLDQLQHREIQIGFFETAVYPQTNVPVAYVAAIQEFGSGPIPPRPFLRPAAADNKDKWGKLISSGVRAALREAIQLDDALGQAGEVGVGDVKNAIEAVQSPELKDPTIYNRRNRKNKNKNQSVKPLVDTGYMRDSVNYAVEEV